MVNWLNAYNLSGAFITEKAFVELWKKIPNKVQYVNRDVSLDLSKINNSWLYSIIPTITSVSRSTNHSSSTTSEEDDIQEYKEVENYNILLETQLFILGYFVQMKKYL